MDNEKVYSMKFARVYPLLETKAIKKNRTRAEVQEVIFWLTGYTADDIEQMLNTEITYREFFEQAPSLNPDRHLIKGTICGVRIEEIKEPLMQEIRYLDKLIDELAKGKSMLQITTFRMKKG